jgi:hypothetical protein
VTEVVNSKNAIPIRPSDERWAHIAEEHVELAGMRADVLGTVATPSAIYQGGAGELLAAHEVQAGKWLVVVYRESSRDGFIITAFLTRRTRSLERRKKLWP